MCKCISCDKHTPTTDSLNLTMWERQQKLNAFRAQFPNCVGYDVESKLTSTDDDFLRAIYYALEASHYGPLDTVTQGFETVTMFEWHEAVYSEMSKRKLSKVG